MTQFNNYEVPYSELAAKCKSLAEEKSRLLEKLKEQRETILMLNKKANDLENTVEHLHMALDLLREFIG